MKIDKSHYRYKGYDIYLAIHPKLWGKYEIFNGEEFMARAFSINDAKESINKYIFFEKQ